LAKVTSKKLVCAMGKPTILHTRGVAAFTDASRIFDFLLINLKSSL
jgi:hypothetical protein